MGFATHLGPWLLGTVKETTGTTAGTIRNTGTTIVSQSVAVLYTSVTANTAAFTLPAGAAIISARFNTTVAYATTTPTIALQSNGVDISGASNTTAFGGTGYTELVLGSNSAAGAVLVSNVGSTDAIITYTQANVTATSGAGVLVITYAVRSSDGTGAPASA
jgi:hypothetical protein